MGYYDEFVEPNAQGGAVIPGEQEGVDVHMLGPGDDVYWADPDGGQCSRALTVGSISINGDVVSIVEDTGSCIEVFADELSYVQED